jgi:hypothetical protein
MSRADAATLVATLRLGAPADREELGEAWTRVDGRAMAATIAWEEGTQWLFRRLADLQLDRAAPASLRAALRAVALEERAAGLRVDAEAAEVAAFLDRCGAPSVLIKGTARRALGRRYPYADARATTDVDVLLRRSDVARVWGVLRGRGWPYATDPAATPDGHYHPPPLRGPNGVSVELHWSTGPAVSADEAWRRAAEGGSEIEWHGQRVRVPGATELLWHGLVHAVSSGPAGFRLRYFLDASAILGAGAAIDWERIGARLAAGDEADPVRARAWLEVAAQLAGFSLPDALPRDRAPFDLGRAIAWRLAVLHRVGAAGLGERLLEEGTRAETGFGVTPVVPGTGAARQTRRWAAGRVARLAYRAWRASGAG